MQLDFFAKLLSVGRMLQPTRAPVSVPPAKPAAREQEAAADVGIGAIARWQTLARDLLNRVGCVELAGRVQVRWNSRMRSTAGTAFPGKDLIHLNPKLCGFGEAEVDRTLRHELAHLLAHARAGRRRIAPHGEEWRRACADLGLVNENRCHTLPLPTRKIARRYAYRCPTCSIVIRRVSPIRRKIACLACCKKYNGGRYHDRFRFVKCTPGPGEPK